MASANTAELDTSSSRHLRGKYAICGIGETTYRRGSDQTTRSLATWAVGNAMADAGMTAADIDGMLSYSFNDSTFAPHVATDLGIRLNFYTDIYGGGSSTECLDRHRHRRHRSRHVQHGRHLSRDERLLAGAHRWYRCALCGAHHRRQIHHRAYGWQSAGQLFAPTFMRHMYEYGTRPEQVAMVKVAHSRHASNNPKAYYKKRYTVDEVLNSRMICKPLHLLDCCVETDNATCVIVTRLGRARDCPRPSAVIQAVAGRVCKPKGDIHLHYQAGPISTVAGYYARDILWPNAGVGPQDIDVTGSYDAFTFTTMLQLEDYGFCAKGEGGEYVSNGTIELGGRRPNNTAGGHLCEGYTHGMNMVIENVRQLRYDADDSCPIGADGRRQHTYDYAEGGCRQVRQVELTANLGWAHPGAGSAMVMARDHR